MNLQMFETLVLPTKNKLFRFAFRLLGSSEEAKDVVQEVMLKVWNGREQMAEVQNMEAWCMRITKNLSLDRLRMRQRRATGPIEDGMEIRHETLTPHERAEIHEHMERINQFMQLLPDKQRQVFCDAHTPGFHVLHFGHLLPSVPHPDHHLLHHVFSLLRAA